ncbi:MAG TPA: hypothetical protein P5556_03125 [Candidatus Gastranaerophilales bacterium]|nr:hypothetical protein [Candidatus Gastranaerophilales bacterium]
MVIGKNIVTASALRNASIFYSTPEFVADQVFPLLQTNSPTMKITKYLPSDYFRNDADVRGEGGEAKRGGFKTTEVTYSTIETAFAVPITDELRRNAKKQSAQPLQPDIEAVELAKRKVMLKRESEVASLITAATWADGVSGGEDAEGAWAAAAGTNTFIADIKKGLKTLREKGIVSNPNLEIRLLLDDYSFDEVVEIAAIKDQIKYTSSESITPDMLARILKIDKVIVPSVIENTAKETKAGTEFTASRIWKINATKGMALLYAYPKRLGLRIMSAGLIINDRFDEEEGGEHERVMKWRESSNHQDVYEVGELRDQLQVCAEAAYMWKDTIVT